MLGDLTKNAQKMGILCAFTDTENKTDLDYWKWLGVDIENLLICKPVGVSGEALLELQFELMREGCAFLGLDSVASLVPKQVLNGTMDDKTYCGSSGILSTFSQKLTGSGILFDKKVAMVGVNQVRDVMSGFGMKTPGGHFWKHACICRLQLTKGNPFDQNYTEMAMGTIEQPVGHSIEVRLLKNQFSKNDRRYTTFTLNYEMGIDVYEDTVDVGIDLDVIMKNGAWYKFLNRETGEILCINDKEVNLQGRNGVRTYFMENPRIFKWVLAQINQYITD
jgi:recombination protein RecA